jgi:hypothetical protein
LVVKYNQAPKSKEKEHIMSREKNEQLVRVLNNLIAIESELKPEQVAIAMDLIKEGASVSVRNSDKDTLFHWLVYNNQEGIYDKQISELVSQTPALINELDGDGLSPLFGLIYRQAGHVSLPCIKKLVDLGASLDVVIPPPLSSDGWTLIHLASYYENLEIVHYLIQHNINIDAQTTTHKYTPLMLAAGRCNIKAMQFLIAFGANIDLPDKLGRTPRAILSYFLGSRYETPEMREALKAFDEAVEAREAGKLFKLGDFIVDENDNQPSDEVLKVDRDDSSSKQESGNLYTLFSTASAASVKSQPVMYNREESSCSDDRAERIAESFSGEASPDWDFAHPSLGMIILAFCVPIPGWAYLVYVLFNSIVECCAHNDEEENAYRYN